MGIRKIPVADVKRDSNQVRKVFRDEGIEGLARSIAEVGLLHPILVKELPGGLYQLVAGERRLRATAQLGYTSVAAIVLAADAPATQVQLVENLQREDLNPVERALSIREFMVTNKLTKVAVARKLGVPRTTLTDWLDPLDIPARYQQALVENFNGGESPLTLSHISEARGLAVRLRSPGLCNVVLEAVLEYRLSKAETREICALVRETPDLPIARAVLAVRRPADIPGQKRYPEDQLWAVERNLNQWMTALDRSSDTLSELRRVSPAYLKGSDRERIVQQLRQLQTLVAEALDQMAKTVVSGAPRRVS